MSKSVYSVVLMDDVVDAVDRLAYEAGTNRSNMINRILAEYVQLATPEQRMQDIFSSIMDAVSGQNALQLMLNASDAMLSMRSAIHYKYNPSMRYVVELYPHSTEELGEVRAGLRTQNPSLLLYIGQFYKLWAGLERAYLEGPPRRSEVALVAQHAVARCKRPQKSGDQHKRTVRLRVGDQVAPDHAVKSTGVVHAVGEKEIKNFPEAAFRAAAQRRQLFPVFHTHTSP